MLCSAFNCRARYRSRLARRSLTAATLFLFAPLVWAAPYAYIANSGSNTVSVIDTATDAVAATVPVGANPYSVAVSPDGSRVYVANDSSNTVSVIDTATETVMATVTVGSLPRGVAVSPNGSRVYVTNFGSDSISVVDTATDTVTATVPVGANPYGVAASPDGSRIYVTNAGSVSVIDTATNTVTATVPVGIIPYGVAVSPDGSRVYVANDGSNTVSVIDTTTNTVTATVPVGIIPYGVAVSPDGSRVYVANDGSNTVSVIDTATDTVTATVPVGANPYGVAVSPDGSRVYVANDGSNTVSVIGTATNTTVGSPIPVGSGPYSVGAFVGPGALIATNSSGSGSAGTQISGTVPTLTNSTACSTTDAVVQSPAQGTVTFSASSGAYTYTPTSGTYSGPDAFTWRGVASGCTQAVAPSTAVSNTATVSLTLNPLLTGLANVTLREGRSTSEAFSLVGSAPFTRTLASSDATVLPPADLTVSPAVCGTVGNLSCTLGITAASVPGTVSVTMAASDKYGDAVNKTLLVTVVAPPTLSGLSNVSVVAGHDGSEPFTDTGTGTLTVTANSSNTTLLPNNGITGQSSCTGAGSCTLTLKPAARQFGTATVTVNVANAYGQRASGTFTFKVTDSAPVAKSASYNVKANSYVSGTLEATASSPRQTLAYSIVSQPAHGSVTVDASTGAFTYKPNHDYTGTDSFTFKASDGTLNSNTATISLKVAAGALAQRSGTGGGAFGPLGLALLAALTALITLVRRKPRGRSSIVGGGKGVAKAGALTLGLVLIGSWLVTPIPARAAGAGPWYAGVQGNVIKPAGGRNSATAGFKGWTLFFGRHLGTHFAVEIDRASYSDYPETLTATANWVNWSLRGLYFPWKSRGAFAPFVLAGLGHQYAYRGDNSEPSNNSASLGLGFTSQPWSAPVAIRADLDLQHGFGGGYTDKIFSLGVVLGFGASD